MKCTKLTVLTWMICLASFLQATGGEGVDVVLNSLSGKAIPASLNLCLSIIKVIKPHISIDIFDI